MNPLHWEQKAAAAEPGLPGAAIVATPDLASDCAEDPVKGRLAVGPVHATGLASRTVLS
ncbi:MAG TPA: hypothetical protein VMT15_00175 [Bryobacteraceae bacterium]|nr:hypothetical protein [Bryobacteraceae bacterium]